MPPDRPQRPIVVDTTTGREAVLMDITMGRAYLRPLHGGREWSVPPTQIRRQDNDDQDDDADG